MFSNCWIEKKKKKNTQTKDEIYVGFTIWKKKIVRYFIIRTSSESCCMKYRIMLSPQKPKNNFDIALVIGIKKFTFK